MIGYPKARRGAEADAVGGTLPQAFKHVTYWAPPERSFKNALKASLLPRVLAE